MAPKKKQAPNGFMVFTFDWKQKYGKNMNLREATAQAGIIWEKMSAQERGPYNEKAKKGRVAAKEESKMTCTGVPISILEKEKQEGEQRERQMKRDIETMVRNSVKKGELETQSYFFIMVNYFTKTLKGGVYVPAEISIAEYSLKDGVCRKYHSFINPGVNIYGHQYEAQLHADTTHRLPLPPNAKGQTNLGGLYNDLLSFVVNKSTGEYPPVFTHCDSMPIVDSVLNFLKADMGANNIDLNVYSIQYLFYILKEATCEMGEVEKPKSHYITDAYFERDFFEYQTGIACTYHEQIDRSKFCTQSCVTRWGFMFSDYMCKDVAISLIPGRHVPESTNLAAIVIPAPDSSKDTESFVSMSSTVTSFSNYKPFNADQKPFGKEDFPTLGASPARKKTAFNAKSQDIKPNRLNREINLDIESEEITDSDLNPWASRSRNAPTREPDTSHFDVDCLRYRDLSTDNDVSSISNCGRGQVVFNRSLNSTRTSVMGGRGRSIQKINP